MKEKDNSKCKEWERRRRGKLNDAFTSLCQILPNYDPAKNLPKIDILERSTEFVKELRLSNSRLLSQQAETDEKCKLIKDLQDEVNKLILRVKQLTILLKQASIPIPLGPSIKSLGKKKLKWSDKLVPENLENNSASTPSVSSILQKRGSCKGGIDSSATGESNQTNTTALTIPLKETNSTEKDGMSTLVTNALPSNVPNVTLLEAPKSTAVQLPLQTIYLTSCPMTPVVNQAPQIIARIALGPTRILPKLPGGISPLHKIAIRQIRKPLPPKPKKTRRRKKKVIVEKVDAETQSQSKFDESAETGSKNISDKKDVSVAVSKDDTTQENIVLDAPIIETSPFSTVEEPLSTLITSTCSVTLGNTVNDTDSETVCKENVETESKLPGTEVIDSKNIETADSEKNLENAADSSITDRAITTDTLMEMDISIAEEIEVSTQIDDHAQGIIPTVDEADKSKSTTAEKLADDIEEIEMNSLSDVPKHLTESLFNPSDKSYMDISEFPPPATVTAVQVELQKPNSAHKEIDEIQKDDIQPNTSKGVESISTEEHSEPMNVDIAPISTLSQETNSSIRDTVTCIATIARSIDLVEAETWGENVHSPKSPSISPTQMFLNMFPLLPREMNRSFFIDSMLPEENPVIAPSSIIPPSASAQDSTSFRLTEISPVHPLPPKASITGSSSHPVINPVVSCSQRSVSKQHEGIIPVKKSVESNPQIHQSPREPNLFEFSNFHPVSEYIDNVFRDASRNRTTPDCRHVSGSAVRSLNQMDFMQPSTSTLFQNQLNQRTTSGNIEQQFSNQDLTQLPVPSIPNLRPHPQVSSQTTSFINQHAHSHATSSRPSNPNSNTAPLQVQETHGTFSYSIDHNLRHPYNEPTTSQKQSVNESLKPQLFRPPVGDFQNQPMYHNLQQTFSTSKEPAIVNHNKSKTVGSDVSKRQKPTSTLQPTGVLQLNQSNVTQMLSKHNYNSAQNLTHVPHSQAQPQPQYQSVEIHIEKPTSQHSRAYHQQKTSAEPSKSYQKSHNKDQTQIITRSSPACQSRRHHATASVPAVATSMNHPNPDVSIPTTSNLHNQPQQISISGQHQQTRRSESSSRTQAQAVASFPDFSLSMNFNQQPQPYEPYNINYSSSGNLQPQPPQPNPVSQPRKNTRPTPFYLQDVPTHCESFSYDTSSNNATLNQQLVNQPYNASKPQYTNPPVHSLSSSGSTSSTSHYFPNTAQSQPPCQSTYAHQNSANLSTRSQQHHASNIAETPLLYNPNPNHNSNQHQGAVSQTKTKASTSISSQPLLNQANYANQHTGNLSNTNASSTSASRPVNWMTDTPYRTSKSNPSQSANNNPTSNLFSVSKLVGNTSTQSSNNITNPITSGTGNNSSSNTYINRNTSYCAEALIRKNPTWDNLNFGSSANQPHQQLPHPPSAPCISYQSSNDHLSFSGYPNNFPHNPHSNPVPGNPNAFSHFDTIHHPSSNQQHGHQQHQYHFSQHHQAGHPHGTTSSVSNFNLSSIFPEINDKRNSSSSNNNNNPPQGSTNSSTGNANCGYYTSTHGNPRK